MSVGVELEVLVLRRMRRKIGQLAQRAREQRRERKSAQSSQGAKLEGENLSEQHLRRERNDEWRFSLFIYIPPYLAQTRKIHQNPIISLTISLWLFRLHIISSNM